MVKLRLFKFSCRFLFLVTGLLVTILSGSSQTFQRPKWHHLSFNYTYRQYLADFHKAGPSDFLEFVKREKIFNDELRSILEHNNGSRRKSWKKGLNQFSDLSHDEFLKRLGYKARPNFGLSNAEKKNRWKFREFEQRNLGDRSISANDTSTGMLRGRLKPRKQETVDWRKVYPPVVSPVKDQGECGSCWTFAAVGTIESRYAIKNRGKLLTLSEQQLASCPFDSNPKHCGGKGGCNGGTPEVAFASVVSAGGIASDWRYPYRSYYGQNYGCIDNINDIPKAVKISSYVQLPSNQYEPLIDSILEGPVAVCVDASQWKNYEEGVFDGCNQTNPDLNHAVIIDGFGVDPEHGEYWLVRNSWSTSYGENGYIRVRRIPPSGTDDESLRCGIDETPQEGDGCDDGPSSQVVCGTCGVLFDASYPVIAD